MRSGKVGQLDLNVHVTLILGETGKELNLVQLIYHKSRKEFTLLEKNST